MFYRNGSCILCNIIFVIMIVSVLQEMVPVFCANIIFVIRLFLFYIKWLLYSVLYHIGHNVVFVLQEWFLYSVLYHIYHKVVSVLREWFLYYVLYHICRKVVFVLREWFLYSVLYHIYHKVVSLYYRNGSCIMCYIIFVVRLFLCTTGMVPVFYAISYLS